MTTNVPLPEFTDAGLAVPTEPQLLAGVMADWVAAFAPSGRQLNTELTTPQGQLAQSQAYMLAQLNAGLQAIVAGVDPTTSGGAFQDALGRIYFLQRQPATFATVQATARGVVGQTLPAGSQARGADGSIWATTASAVFGANGSAPVELRALVAGAGPSVGPNGLSIYQSRPGWESITNAGPSIPGVDTESRAAFETRRAESVQIGGRGTAASVRAAVANVPGVSDVYVYNNGSAAPIVYGTTSYPIPAHSIAVTVAGGDAPAIAEAIHAKLDAGCGMSSVAGEGTLITEVIEDTVNYVPPYPAYPVRFVRPAAVPLYVAVDVANLDTLPNTFVADVQRAVSDAITNGYSTPGRAISVQRARIGGQVVAAAYIAPIQALGNVVPVDIRIGYAPDPTGRTVTLGIDQLPTCAPLNVQVTAV